MYVSQEEVFSDFNNTEALFWFQRDLVYGDWNTGENGDGCYEYYKEMEIPEVGMTKDGWEVQCERFAARLRGERCDRQWMDSKKEQVAVGAG